MRVPSNKRLERTGGGRAALGERRWSPAAQPHVVRRTMWSTDAMEVSLLVLSVYFIPASIFIGTMLVAARLLRRPRVLVFEHFTWVLPGITSWLLLAPLGLEQAFRGKSLSNLAREPRIIAALASVLFLVRLIVGVRLPAHNRSVARWFVGLSNLLAAVVFVAMPGIGE